MDQQALPTTQQALPTTQQSSINHSVTQDLATLVSLITNPLLMLTQQMQQQQQSLDQIQQLLALQMQGHAGDYAGKFFVPYSDTKKAHYFN